MVSNYLFYGNKLSENSLDKYKKLVLHGLSNMDHITFGIFLDELVLNGDVSLDDVIEGHPLAEELYQKWQAEQIQLTNIYSIYEKKNNGYMSLKRWENGPNTRDGYRRALIDWHKINNKKLPNGFWDKNKEQLIGMFNGILQKQSVSV